MIQLRVTTKATHIFTEVMAHRGSHQTVSELSITLMTAGTVRPHGEPGKSVESGRPCLPTRAFTPSFSYTYCSLQIDCLFNLHPPPAPCLLQLCPADTELIKKRKSNGSAWAWLLKDNHEVGVKCFISDLILLMSINGNFFLKSHIIK